MATRSPLVAYDAPTSVKINGVDLRTFGLELTDYPSILLPPIERRAISLPLMHGEIDLGYRYAPREFTLTFQIRGLDHADMIAKRDKFLQWIQQPALLQEFIIEGTPIKALRFELAGHGYRYSQGTVSATAGSAYVTGSGTAWLGRVTPGCEFRFASLPYEKFIVLSVIDDTHLVLNKPVSQDISNDSYWVTRARYLLVNYAGSSEASPFSGARGMFKDKLFNFSVSFRASYPFWIGEELIESVTSAGFVDVYNPSNFYVRPLIRLSGATTEALKIVSGAMSLHGTTGARDSVQNLNAAGLTGSTLGYTAPYLRFVRAERSDKVGLGIFGRPDGTKGDVVKFMSMFRDDGKATPSGVPDAYPKGMADRVNLNQGTVRIVLTPHCSKNDGLARSYLRIPVGEGYLAILKTPSGKVEGWAGNKSVAIAAEDNPMVPGQTSVILFRWDTRSGELKLQVDSVAEAATVTPDAMRKAPNFVGLGARVHSASYSSEPANANFHSVTIWDIPLTDSEFSMLSSPDTDPSTVHPEHIIAGFPFNDETAGNVAVGYWEGDWALEFDGSSQYIQVPYSENLHVVVGAFAADAWVKLNARDGNEHVVLAQKDGEGTGRIWIGADYDAYNNGAFYTYLGGALLATNVVPTVGVWYHIAVTYDGSILEVYVNGQKEASDARSIEDATGDFVLGTSKFLAKFWNGAIATVRIYNRSLTESEIQQLTAGLDPKDVLPDYDEVCVLDYRFDRNSANWDADAGTVKDQSPAGNDGTLEGFTWTNSYPDQLVRAWVGFKGFCSQRTEVIDADDWTAGSEYVIVGSGSGFEPGDLVCVWDEAGNRAICEISAVDYDEESDNYKITFASVNWASGSSLTGDKKFISKNLLANPDFEEGVIHWNVITGSPLLAGDTGTVKTNSTSLSITTDATNSYNRAGQRIEVPPEKSFVFRGWRHKGSSDGARFDIVGDGGFTPLELSENIYTSDWAMQETTFETTSTQTYIEVRATVYDSSAAEEDTAYFDTLQLFENKVANPGFEVDSDNNGLADGWYEYDPNDAITPSINTTNRHSGNAAQQLDIGSDPQGGFIFQTIHIPSGAVVEVSAWIYNASDATLTFKLSHNKPDGAEAASFQIEPGKWTRISTVFRNFEGGDTVFRFVPADSGTWIIDDVTVRPIYDVPLEITPMAKLDHFVVSDKGTGYLIDGSGSILFEDVPGRASEMTLLVRGQLQGTLSTLNLAKWFNSDAPDSQYAALRFEWSATHSVWVLAGDVCDSHYTKLQIDDESIFQRPFELAMRLTPYRAVEDDSTGLGTVYVVDLFLNGKRLTPGEAISTLTQNAPFTAVILGYGASLPSGSFDQLLIGGGPDSLAQCLIYEVEAWARGLSDEEIQRGYTEWVTSQADRAPEQRNAVFEVNTTLASNQELKVDFSGDLVRDARLITYDTEHNEVSDQTAYPIIDGESLTLKPDFEHERSVIYVSGSHGGLKIIFRPHWL